MPDTRTLLLASETEATRLLARALDAEFEALPDVAEPNLFEAWRETAMKENPRKRIVVAPWIASPRRAELNSVDADEWAERFERPYLLWNFALGVAGRRCADDGAVVGLVQSPAVLDAAGWTPELAIADGVLALIRSVAAAEGARGVRANLVTTPIGLVAGDIVAPAPPLPGFPGTIERHVAGALRTFLSEDAVGLTGRVLSADGGRSL